MPGKLEDFSAKAVDAAKIAGEVDLVTENDKKCEELIFYHLKQHFPEHKVGTNCDKATVDESQETTNRINGLLFKVTGDVAAAAGAVIVTEAGGLVFDPSSKDFDITSQHIAASNPLLKDAFIKTLKQSGDAS